MGFSIKFNWVLQIDAPDGLSGSAGPYPFNKSGNRVFPLDTPIDLIDPDRNAIAKIRVVSFTNVSGQTTGLFNVIKLYTGEEQTVLTQYWKDNE